MCWKYILQRFLGGSAYNTPALHKGICIYLPDWLDYRKGDNESTFLYKVNKSINQTSSGEDSSAIMPGTESAPQKAFLALEGQTMEFR